MGRALSAKGAFQKCKEFLDPMPQLETRELKLTGHCAHIFAGGGEEIDATLGELFGLGLREIAPIAYNDPILHPARERIKELTIIDRGGG